MPEEHPEHIGALTPVEIGSYRDDVHKRIVNAVAAQFDRYQNGGWEENQVTTAVATALVDSGPQVLQNGNRLISVSWQAQRFNGPAEYQRGDLGIAVHFNFPNQKYLSGYAHLEAKLFKYEMRAGNEREIDPFKGSFKELSYEQLRKHLEHTHAHYVLLYDCSPEDVQPGNSPIMVVPRAETLISNLVLELHTRQRTLYQNTEPCSHLIANRLLHGYGLDYRSPPQHVVKMWDSPLPAGIVLHGYVAHHEGHDRPDPPNRNSSGDGPGGGDAVDLAQSLEKIGFNEWISRKSTVDSSVVVTAADLEKTNAGFQAEEEAVTFLSNPD